jgi:glucose-6-phosphate dehydrogenase assembly protein OpcA
MAAAVAERVWRTSSPATIERDLADLWRDVATKGKVARAIMSNLVVVRASRIERRAGVSIDAVAGQHPSRVLIIDHEQPTTGPCEITGARVGVVTYGPPEARYGVEQVAVRSACTDESLPALIRRLVRGERPISVWFAEDLSNVPLLPSIVEMGRQLVYDSRHWHDVRRAIQALEPWQHLDLADVNWRRLASIRRAVILAAGIDRTEWRPSDLRIAVRPDNRSLAWLLIGWLASRLDWADGVLPHIEDLHEHGTILSVSIGQGPDLIQIRSEGRQVVVQHASRPPMIVGVPHEGEADAVAAELHTLSHDVRLHDALSALQRHFSAA